MSTITRYQLKSDEKFDLIVKLGSYGTIKLLFRWSNAMSAYIVGGETQEGEPLFYGQTLITGVDLLKSFRTRNVPTGILGILKKADFVTESIYATPDTILNYDLIYSE